MGPSLNVVSLGPLCCASLGTGEPNARRNPGTRSPRGSRNNMERQKILMAHVDIGGSSRRDVFLFNYIIASLAHFVSLPCCGSNSRLPSVWQRSLDVVQGPAAHCWSCLITSGAAAASCSSASYCANRVTCGFGDLRFDPDMVSREPVAIWFTSTFCMM